MVDFVAAPVAPDHVTYLDQAAQSGMGRDYKRRFLETLDLRPGQCVLDVGCGPGTDLVQLADAVGATGTVIGVDHDAAMVDTARLRTAGRPTIDVRAGDVHALPLAAGTVDRARTDRVLQHVSDPARALAELRRVLRPGGLVGMAEPDWGTLFVDDDDVATSDAFAGFMASQVRNPLLGRQLARRAVEAGFEVRTVEASVMMFRDVDSAEQILGLRRNTVRAVQSGAMDSSAARHWLHRIAGGPFLACFTLFTVTAQA